MLDIGKKSNKDIKQNNKINCETQIEKLKEELEKTKKEVNDYKNKYLRALADYQNFERRIIDEKSEAKKTANKELILKLLSFLDNLDRAEVFVTDNNLKIIKKSFLRILSEEGLQEIDVLNKEFDPHLAEVIDIIKGDKDNIVIEVIRKGYKFRESILRVAQVKVSKKVNN